MDEGKDTDTYLIVYITVSCSENGIHVRNTGYDWIANGFL